MHAKMDARLISNHEYDAMRTEIDRLRADLSVARHRIRELEAEVYALKKHDQCDHSDCHPTRCVIAAARAGIR